MVTTPAARPPDDRVEQPRRSLRRAARGGALNLVSAGISAVATFGLTVVVTRGVSLDVAGVFFASTSVFVLLITIGRLGTDTSLVYFLSRCRALGHPERITSYVRVALRPVVVVGLAMSVGLFSAAPHVARWIASGQVAETTSFLRVLAIFVPLASVEYVLLAATRGMGTMRPSAVVEQILRPVSQLVLVALAVVLSATGLLPWAWGGTYLVAAAFAVWWWLHIRRSTGLPAGRIRVGTRFWRFSIPRSLTGAAQVGMQRLDIVLVAALAGVGPAAIYTATTRFIVLGQLARNAVSQAVQPPLAEALARNDRAEANELFQVSTAWLILVAWPIYLVLASSGGPLLRVFGQSYSEGHEILLVLSVGMLIAIACGDVDVVLVMAGRPSWSMWNVFLAFGSNVAIDLWLIPGHGAVGAAIGWSAAMAIKNLTALVQVGTVMRLHPVGPASLTAAASALVSFLAVPIALVWLPLSGPGQVTLELALGIIIYSVVVWWMRKTLHLAQAFRFAPRNRPTNRAAKPMR